MQEWLMTKDWKVLYKGATTRITYAAWYKQKIGLGAGGDAKQRSSRGYTVLCSPYPKNFNQAYINPKPQGQLFYILL